MPLTNSQDDSLITYVYITLPFSFTWIFVYSWRTAKGQFCQPHLAWHSYPSLAPSLLVSLEGKGGVPTIATPYFSELYLCLWVVEQLLLQCLSLPGDADESADVSCYFGLCGALEAEEYLEETGQDCWGVAGVGPCPEGILVESFSLNAMWPSLPHGAVGILRGVELLTVPGWAMATDRSSKMDVSDDDWRFSGCLLYLKGQTADGLSRSKFCTFFHQKQFRVILDIGN